MENELTIPALLKEAAIFAKTECAHNEPALYGVTDGKAVGTYLEHKFTAHLMENYSFAGGNSAAGIDIPSINVDIKVTSIKQPQSSCPYKSARQKIFGLGYNLIVFVYDKSDDANTQTGRLDIKHTIFVEKHVTGDFQMTRGLRDILENDGNEDDLIAFMMDRNLPIDEIEANNIAADLMKEMPVQGYLTISNALQWRLQYGRIIQQADAVSGIIRVT